MRKLITAAAFAATAIAVPASAQTIIYTANTYTVPAFVNATPFEEFERGVTNTAYTGTAGGQASGGYVQTVTQPAFIRQGTIPGRAVSPDSDNNKYLSIEGAGALNVNFGTGVNVFSFVFGSLDSYNTLTLAFSNGTSRTFTGREIIGGAAPTNTFPVQNYGDTGRVTYDTGGAFRITGATFGSTFSSFEVDSFAAAVPEPATWGLMILGFGAIGAQLRTRRSRKGTLATA